MGPWVHRLMQSNSEPRICDVSVVAPLYRTEEFLGELARRTTEVLGEHGLSHELILVDDCSPGRDLEAACKLADEDGRIGVVGLRRNVGQNLAGIIGMGYASGRWTVLIDADLQDPPEVIPRLIEEAERGFDAVFGGRAGNYETWHRRLTSRLYKLLQAWICRVPADAGLFVVLSRPMVDRLGSEACLESRVVPMIGLSGLPIASLSIERVRRPRGSSAYSSLRRLRVGVATLAFAGRWRFGLRSSARPLPDDVVSLLEGRLSRRHRP